MYKVINTPFVSFVFDVTHEMSIPLDPANTDYQRYLAWLAAGNTAEVIEA